MAHAAIDHNKVYDVAVKHAPALLAAVREVLKEFPEPPVTPSWSLAFA
jgi:hypothetical protein